MDMSLGELREFGDGQGGMACCNSWGRKESDTAEQLNWTLISKWQEDTVLQRGKVLRQSIPRQADKKSKVPKKEKGVGGSQGGKEKLF